MTILFLSDDFPPNNLGGAGTVAYNLAKTIKELGHDVFVVSTTQDKNEEGDHIQNGLRVYKIYSQYHRRWRAYLSLYNPQTVNKVSKIIADIKPDVVHAHNIHYHLSYYCLKIAKKSGAKVFLTAHEVMSVNYGKIKIPKEATCENYINYTKQTVFNQIRENKRRYNLFRNVIIKHYLNKYVDKIFAVSVALKKILIYNGIRNVEVVHNGIDVNMYEIDLEAVSIFKKTNDLENKRVILFGGRVSEGKGINQIIQALGLILKTIPNALLVVAGSDNLEIGRVILPVKFLGYLSQKNIKLALVASDIVVSPSICCDPFPNINLEAMACKKPVISTCFGGSSEVVTEGKTGYIINPYDIKTMADRIVDLLKSSEKSREFGQRGYEQIRDFFNLRQQAEKYLNYY